MSEEQTIARSEILALTTEIVSAHVSNNATVGDSVPDLIQSVFDTLTALASDEPAPVELTPAVPIRKSVTDDHIVCLEDGKQLKMLKRHLMTSYGMTPEDYRAKWGLKADYPMVAPAYARKRQELAKKIGLGRRPRVAEQAPAPAPAPKARRSRTKAAA
jgi:predicted transcriptional regulator